MDEQISLLSNGDAQHLGLCVQQPDGSAYAIGAETYFDGQIKNFGSPTFALAAGVYDVQLVLKALKGKSGVVNLVVTYEGRNGSLEFRCEN